MFESGQWPLAPMNKGLSFSGFCKTGILLADPICNA